MWRHISTKALVLMPVEQLTAWLSQHGYPAIFALLMLGIIGLPVPDETLLTLTGFLVYRGTLHLIPAFLSAFFGASCGISASYWIGRLGGDPLVRKFGHLVRLSPDRFERVGAWFLRRGKWSLTIGYFIPGVRHVIAIIAGSSRLDFRTFAAFAYSGAFVWAALFIGAGYFLGEEWQQFPAASRHIAIGLLIAGIVVFAAIRGVRKLRAGSPRG
jgi:membrane protein DedA with SNARE-associated domain